MTREEIIELAQRIWPGATVKWKHNMQIDALEVWPVDAPWYTNLVGTQDGIAALLQDIERRLGRD